MSASADISKFLAGLAQARERAIEAATEAVDLAGEHIIGDAQQLCPVDTGALQASGTTLPAEVADGKITKVIGFNTSYAAAVHERPRGQRRADDTKRLASQSTKALRKTARRLGIGGRNSRDELVTKIAARRGVGQNKFLETAVRRSAPRLPEFVATHVRRAL